MMDLPDFEFIIIEHDDENAQTAAPSRDKTGWETVIFDLIDEEDG